MYDIALKYDGFNLGLLTRIFEYVPLERLTDYIKSKPTGKYARRIWFFYEFLTGKQLPIDDTTSGNYVYNKETKSSFEIEHIKPNASRTEKFITSLTFAEKDDFCEKERLIEF